MPSHVSGSLPAIWPPGTYLAVRVSLAPAGYVSARASLFMSVHCTAPTQTLPLRAARHPATWRWPRYHVLSTLHNERLRLRGMPLT